MRTVPVHALDFWQQVAVKMGMSEAECLALYESAFAQASNTTTLKRRKWSNKHDIDLSKIQGITKKKKALRLVLMQVRTIVLFFCNTY